MIDLVTMVAAGIVAALSAALVLRTAPGNRRNRALAAVLAIEAAGSLWGVAQWYQSVPATLSALGGWLYVGGLSLAYLVFLGTLATPLARIIGSRRAILAAASVTVLGLVATAMGGALPPAAIGGAAALMLGLLAASSILGLTISFSAWRRAEPGSPQRVRARAFALAFGVRDGGWALMVVSVVLPAALGRPPWGGLLWDVMPSLVTVVYVPLLAYGIVRHQLFDIDVKLKVGVSRGTVAAIFVVIYLVANELARTFVAPNVGTAVGLVAAALLMLAIVPLQRAAERVAAALVPASKEPVSARKLEIYRLALEDAHELSGEGLTPHDERTLAQLRRTLGLSERDHEVLHHAVRARPRQGDRRVPVKDVQTAGMIGKYRIIEAIGMGSFGRTLLAEDPDLGRRVVVKLVHQDHGDPDAILDEARAMARVRHPNVVTVHDVGKADGRAFIVMEHAEQGSLRDRLARGPLTLPEFRGVALGILDALDAVHAAGLVHRDVKPANVLLTARGEAKLADFGIARAPGHETTVAGLGGGLAGTVRFMAPEQAKGLRVTARSDLYSAAATLFEALTGSPYVASVAGESGVELQMRVAGAGPYTRECGAGPALDAWFGRALAPAPADRFADAREARDALARALPVVA